MKGRWIKRPQQLLSVVKFHSDCIQFLKATDVLRVIKLYLNHYFSLLNFDDFPIELVISLIKPVDGLRVGIDCQLEDACVFQLLQL